MGGFGNGSCGMLNKVKEWLCGFTADKYVHVFVCLVIALVVARIVPFGTLLSAAHGILAAMLIGLAKEWVDDEFDCGDIKADAVGALLGALLSLI